MYPVWERERNRIHTTPHPYNPYSAQIDSSSKRSRPFQAAINLSNGFTLPKKSCRQRVQDDKQCKPYSHWIMAWHAVSYCCFARRMRLEGKYLSQFFTILKKIYWTLAVIQFRFSLLLRWQCSNKRNKFITNLAIRMDITTQNKLFFCYNMNILYPNKFINNTSSVQCFT